MEITPALRVKIVHSDGRSLPDELYSYPWNVAQETHYDVPIVFDRPVPILPARLEPGAFERVRTTYHPLMFERPLYWQLYVDARGWERIRVPAGEFDCLCVDRRNGSPISMCFDTARSVTKRFGTHRWSFAGFSANGPAPTLVQAGVAAGGTARTGSAGSCSTISRRQSPAKAFLNDSVLPPERVRVRESTEPGRGVAGRCKYLRECPPAFGLLLLFRYGTRTAPLRITVVLRSRERARWCRIDANVHAGA